MFHIEQAKICPRDQEIGDSIQPGVSAAAAVAANTFRLLIAGSQAGGLIGPSGQNIELIRGSSGATISVLAQNQLPFCGSAQESDRVVQVSLSLQLPASCKRYR